MFDSKHDLSRVLIAAAVMVAMIAVGATGAVATDSEGVDETTDSIAAADGGAVLGGAAAGVNADNKKEAVANGAWNGFKAGAAIATTVSGPAGGAVAL